MNRTSSRASGSLCDLSDDAKARLRCFAALQSAGLKEGETFSSRLSWVFQRVSFTDAQSCSPWSA